MDQIIIQIKVFFELNINEIFEEIDSLDSSSFSISKNSDKYILKIKLEVFRKEKYLLIDLEENKNMKLTNRDIINYYENIIKSKDRMILKLNEIIENKDEEIKILKEQLKNNKYYIFENKDDERIQKLYRRKRRFHSYPAVQYLRFPRPEWSRKIHHHENAAGTDSPNKRQFYH